MARKIITQDIEKTVIDNQTGEYWDSESDYFWHLIDLSKQGVL